VRESSRVNSVDIVGPDGSTYYNRRPDGTPYAQVTELSDANQGIYDTRQGITAHLTDTAQNRVNGLTQQGFSLDGVGYNPAGYGEPVIPAYQPGQVPYDPSGYGDFESYSARAGDAAFAEASRYLTPQYEKENRRLEQRLADQGFAVGDEAWNGAYGEMQRGQQQGWQSAANNATMIAGQEADRRIASEQGLRSTSRQEGLVDHQQGVSDKTTQIQTEQGLRNTQIQEMLMERNQDFNEASVFLTGAPVMGAPQAPNMPSYRVDAPDVAGIYNNNFNQQMSAHNANQASAGGMWKGIGQIAGMAGSAPQAGSLLAKCSRDYKEDDGPPTRILDVVNRIPIRTWRYKAEHEPDQPLHIGPYAEDWKRETGLGDGKTINLIDMMGVSLRAIQELSKQVSDLERKVA